MNSLEIRNRKIIDAVIRNEQAVCPGTIALIGIYGSFQTGDIHPRIQLAGMDETAEKDGCKSVRVR